MIEPVETSCFCAVVTPQRDDIPIKTDNPVRANRRKHAADSMAIKPLQKISIQALASGYSLLASLDRLKNCDPYFFRQTANLSSADPVLCRPALNTQTGGVLL